MPACCAVLQEVAKAPVQVALNAVRAGLFNYGGGVWAASKCAYPASPPSQYCPITEGCTDHAVLVRGSSQRWHRALKGADLGLLLALRLLSSGAAVAGVAALRTLVQCPPAVSPRLPASDRS